MINVHMLEDFDAATRADLQARLDARLHFSFGEDLSRADDIHILIAGRPQREYLIACPNLRAVIIPWAGVPDRTQALLHEFPHIAAHNLHHNAAATAETALALLMAAAKFIVPADRKLRMNDWSPRYEPSRSIGLEGRTALILGYGQIGQRVGRVCRALGMPVIATRRNRDAISIDGEVELHSATELYQLLPRAEV